MLGGSVVYLIANLQKLTGTFLRKYVLKTSDRLCEEYDQQTSVDQDKRLMEYEAQILIELYALRFEDIPLENSSVSIHSFLSPANFLISRL